jgi:hypothetical protein
MPGLDNRRKIKIPAAKAEIKASMRSLHGKFSACTVAIAAENRPKRRRGKGGIKLQASIQPANR